MTWWLEHPGLSADQLTQQLTTQAWLILDDMFRRGGVELDPSTPYHRATGCCPSFGVSGTVKILDSGTDAVVVWRVTFE